MHFFFKKVHSAMRFVKDNSSHVWFLQPDVLAYYFTIERSMQKSNLEDTELKFSALCRTMQAEIKRESSAHILGTTQPTVGSQATSLFKHTITAIPSLQFTNLCPLVEIGGPELPNYRYGTV